MSVFTCKMCGAVLPISENSIAECEYCGTSQTISTATEEKLVTLYNRANKLRFECEFDNAQGIYQSIVTEYQAEAEAYWGLCLCKFGIEYVDDEKTGKKVPTCHRTLPTSILDDMDYKNAVDKGDLSAKKLYEQEAAVIDTLQKKILQIVNAEKPYDVFVCYKETDDLTKLRTDDSTLAQDIYTELTKEGYRVFFSRVSLRQLAGSEYEPYIYAALYSAKVMLAIGTKPEYYNAVWVKNEWKRYIDMMRTNSKKKLIACYKNIDPYDLPREFKNLQGLDMGDISFFDSLRSIINDAIPKKQEKTAQVAATAPNVNELWYNEGIYRGETAAGKPHGKGKIEYKDGGSYDGEWAFGEYRGQGTLIYSNGRKYVGEFKAHKRNGKGTMYYPNGEEPFVGLFKDDDFFQGKGTVYYNDGCMYLGEWKDGKRNGKGYIIYPNGRKLEGEFKNDFIWNGTGYCTYSDGKAFEGTFIDGKCEGYGTLYYFDGNVAYEGGFKNGYYHGKGIEYESDGTIRRKGKWKEGSYPVSPCYVATCVYGSYDCPQVWTLRRYRDNTLASTWYGRAFIKTYYAISPTIVKWFGNTRLFKKTWRGVLDKMVSRLNKEGVENTPYKDKKWR